MRYRVTPVVLVCSLAIAACERSSPAGLDLTPDFATSEAAPTHLVSGGGPVPVTINGEELRSTYAFNASMDGAGAIDGQVELHFSSVPWELHGTVTCLAVEGNDAWIGFVLTRSNATNPRWQVGQESVFQTQDRGEGIASPPDGISSFRAWPAEACNDRPELPLRDWTNGNVQVSSVGVEKPVYNSALSFAHNAVSAQEPSWTASLASLPGNRLTAEVVNVGRACSIDPLLADPTGKIALIERGACFFAEKMANVTAAGAVGGIIYNSAGGGENIFTMGAPAGTDIPIPGVFVARSTGLALGALAPVEATIQACGLSAKCTGAFAGRPAPILAPSDRCVEHPLTSIATFEDDALRDRVMAGLGVASADDLTCGRLATLLGLDAGAAGIESLVGIQNLVGLLNAELGANAITDATPLSGLTGLEFLQLTENLLTDLDAVSGLTNLWFLSAGAMQITDLSPVSGLTGLTQLGLTANPVSDLAPLSGLGSLEILGLQDTDVTDVSPLAGLVGLRELWLTNSPTGDISALSGLVNLTALGVGGNGLTDITAVTGMTQLGYVGLEGNPFSDIGPLLANPGIGAGDRVDLWSTLVSCADVDLLRARGVDVGTECAP